MIENHTHISSLRDSEKHRGRCYPYYAPDGALENTRDVATHSTPLTGLPLYGKIIPTFRPYGALKNSRDVATHSTPRTGLWKTPGTLLPIARP